MRFHADDQVQEDLASRKTFTEVRHEPVTETDISGVEAYGVNPFLPGNEDSSFIMEPLAYDDKG